MVELNSLGLKCVEEMDDLSPLGDMRALTQLVLYDYPDDTDFRFLGNLREIEALDPGLATYVPGLTELGFLNVRPLEEIDQLARLTALHKLSIRHCQVEDLTPLTAVGSLRTLEIVTPVEPNRLAQINRLPQLTTLIILSSPDEARDIDLSGLGDVELTVRAYPNRHRIVGAGKRIKVKWL